MPRTRSRQRGVTMVEILIAVLVLTAGLLGLASLQGVSLHNSFSAYQRSQAISLAYEVMDRIRADRDFVVGGGGYDGFEDEGDDQAAAMLTEGSLEIDVQGQVIVVTVTWLDDRLQEDEDEKYTSLELRSRI